MNQVLQYGLRDSHPDAPPSGYAAVYVLESDNEVYRQLPDGTTKQVSGTGALSDAGSDNADGGDQYQLPQAEDSIDLQSSGDIEKAASIDTDEVNGGVTGSNAVTNIPGSGLTVNSGSLDVIGRSEMDWTEDGNSPKTVSGVTSTTYTLSGTYDLVDFQFTVTNNSSGGAQIQLRVNGDSGSNYKVVDDGGSISTGITEYTYLVVTEPGGPHMYEGRMMGRWGNAHALTTVMTEYEGGVHTGKNANVSSPLDQFTILTKDGESIDATIEVYGKDIA